MSAALQLAIKRFAVADFESLPQGSPNFEYDEGEIISPASHTAAHQDILAEALDVSEEETNT